MTAESSKRTMLEPADYMKHLVELQKRGDGVPGIVEVIGLFKEPHGQDRAWDVMHSIPSGHAKTYREWLAWRVMQEAIQYFSPLWRDDVCFLRYYEEYRKFADEGIRSHKRWKV